MGTSCQCDSHAHLRQPGGDRAGAVGRNVAGAAALYASTHPGKSAKDIRSALLQSATATPALAGKSTTGARLNLAQVIAPSTGVSSATPAKFEAPRVVNGQFRVKLTGAIGQVYEVQVSPNLKTWTTAGTATNTTGTVEAIDTISASWPHKYYRAITK